jgi:2'-5' RNA ligase
VRLFAALEPSPEAIDHLTAAVTPLQDDALRWTSVSDWHLTMAFYGELDEARLPGLKERLVRAAGRHGPVSLALAGAGRFGTRALWVGCTGELLALRRLSQSAIAAGRRAGADVVDKRRFKAHVTLARTYRNRPTDLRPYVAALAEYEGPQWIGHEIQLLQSHLGEGRPRYETLATATLTA